MGDAVVAVDDRLLATPPRIEAVAPKLPPGAGGEGTAGVLLRAGLGLFAARGFYGTSIRDIATSAGVRSATLYGHFPSKESMLGLLVEIGHLEHNRRLRAIRSEEMEPEDALRALVEAHVLFHAEYPVLGTVANNELHVLVPELAAPAVALRRESEHLLLDAVERGIADGCFSTPDAWLCVAAIGGMGIRVANWFSPSFPRPATDVAAAYADFALRIVGSVSRSSQTNGRSERPSVRR